jgi:hypothetical protein
MAESAEVYHILSTDDGLTWSELANVSRMGDSVSTAPCLAVGPDEHLHCAWMQYRGDLGSFDAFDYFYSEYDGETWSEPANVTQRASNTNAASSGSIAVDPSEAVHLVVEYVVPGYSYSILHAVNRGDSWTTPVQVSDSPYDDGLPGVAATSDGRVHVVWRQYRGTAPGFLYYSRFDSVWTPPRMLGEYPDGVQGACIASSAGDRLHVVYLGNARRNAAEVYYITSPDGDSWSVPENVSESPMRRTSSPAVTVDSIGRVCVVWCDEVLPGGIVMQTFYRVRYGVWGPKMQLTADTVSTGGIRLGASVKDGKVDLLWLQRLSRSPEASAIYYMRLRVPEVGISEGPTSRVARLGLVATPSPFSVRTTIQLPVDDRPLLVGIFDLSGRLVRRLVTGSRGASAGAAVWDGRDERGRTVAGGVYLVEATSPQARGAVLVVKQ